MTTRSQIWDGAVWVDLTGGIDTATLDALYLRLDGGNAMSGDLDMGGNNILAGNGSINADTPAYGFVGNPSTGIYSEPVFNDINFMISGNRRMTIGDTGFSLSDGVSFNHDPDTTAATPDATFRLFFGNQLELVRNTSARRYKENIVYDSDLPVSSLADMVLNPVRFYHPGDDDSYIGFIAEDIEDQDTDAVTYMDDENGDPRVENYDLRAVVAILAAKVNRLEGA